MLNNMLMIWRFFDVRMMMTIMRCWSWWWRRWCWWWCVRMWMNSGVWFWTTYWVAGSDESRSLAASNRMCHGARADNGSRLRIFSRTRCWARRRCSWTPASSLTARCAPSASPGRGCHRILCVCGSGLESESIVACGWQCGSHDSRTAHGEMHLPFRDRMYDCQNFAFLLAVSLRPIISKCCLNMLKAGF